jgi:hypothetical protein
MAIFSKIDELRKFRNDWESEFGIDLFENWQEYGSFTDYIHMLFNQFFPIWIREWDEEMGNVVKKYRDRLAKIWEVERW